MALLITAAVLIGCDSGSSAKQSPANVPAASASKASVNDVRQLAEDAYAYGLQQVIFYQTRYNYTQNSETNVYEGVNRWNLVNDGNPIDPSFKAIVTPNATTAYAIGFLDIQAEPAMADAVAQATGGVDDVLELVEADRGARAGGAEAIAALIDQAGDIAHVGVG